MFEIDENTDLDEIFKRSQLVAMYGSRLYGTSSEDSDYDFVAVLRNGVSKKTPIIIRGDFNVSLYTENEFKLKIENHDIVALEVLFGRNNKFNEGYYSKYYKSLFKLDLNKLRESISTITSHSWIKGKKKLIVSGDYDKKAGVKSIFHSIRILDFAIQFINNGIIDEMSMVWLWTELKQLMDKYDHDELWNVIDARYRELYNKTKSDFKKLAPKDTDVRDKQRELVDMLKLYNCYSVDLTKEIMNIFKDK